MDPVTPKAGNQGKPFKNHRLWALDQLAYGSVGLLPAAQQELVGLEVGIQGGQGRHVVAQARVQHPAVPVLLKPNHEATSKVRFGGLPKAH